MNMSTSSKPNVVQRIDLPCAVAGFDAPPCPVRFRLVSESEGWSLILWTPPGKATEAASWLDAYAPSAMLIAPGDSAQVIQARFPLLPARWSELFADLSVQFVKIWPHGVMRIFLKGDLRDIARLKAAVGLGGGGATGEGGDQVGTHEETEFWRDAAIRDARRRFVTHAWHELNTPLTPIVLHVAHLKDLKPPPTPEAEKSLEIIQRNAARLGFTVRELFDRFLGSQETPLELTRKPARLDELLAACVEAFRPGAATSGIELKIRDVQPISIMLDPGRIAQSFFNVLSAAIRLTPRGGRIRVEVDTPGDQVVIAVGGEGERGPQATKQQCEDLFLPPDLFGLRSRVLEGPGLELFIAKAIAEAHGGRLGCRSEGTGATVTITLTIPLVPAPPAEEAPEDPKRPGRAEVFTLRETLQASSQAKPHGARDAEAVTPSQTEPDHGHAGD